MWGDDQWALDIAYDMGLSDAHADIAALPACAECLRVAELLANPDTAPPLHRRVRRPRDASAFSGDEVRGLLGTDIATGAPPGRRAAVHLLTFTAVPDQPGFGDLVEILDLVWGMGDTVRMGQVTDWAEVSRFAATAGVPDRDRKLVAVAASLAGGPPVSLESAVSFADDPAAAQRLIEAIAIATGHGDRWELVAKEAAGGDQRG